MSARLCLLFTIGFPISIAAFAGCVPASNRFNNSGADLTIPPAGSDLAFTSSTDQSVMACAGATFKGQQSAAALLVLLDRSQSMGMGNKYNFSAQAIVQAIDADSFDTMSVGLYAAPSMQVAGPDCILNTPVACGSPAFPQVALAPAGKDKSMAMIGPRHDIFKQLMSLQTDPGPGNANPMYEALQNAIMSLQAWPGMGKRILFMITDGTVDCCEGSGRAGCYVDGNGCHDWENPASIIKLLSAANKDPNAPVETFIMGVPGADTYDPTGINYPPYHMRAALSAMAWAGSPNYVNPLCTGRTFAQNTLDPAISCHFDFTQNLKIASIAQAITSVRGKVLGCLFELPSPDGGVVDPMQVNVSYTVGGMSVDLKKRVDPKSLCATDGCWDYLNGKVQLIGKACMDVQGGLNPQVKIVVGCPTIIG